jgi:hypothetical protein
VTSRTEDIVLDSFPLVLISGIPGTGKSTFGGSFVDSSDVFGLISARLTWRADHHNDGGNA